MFILLSIPFNVSSIECLGEEHPIMQLGHGPLVHRLTG
jgi:hypothetical protein